MKRDLDAIYASYLDMSLDQGKRNKTSYSPQPLLVYAYIPLKQAYWSRSH